MKNLIKNILPHGVVRAIQNKEESARRRLVTKTKASASTSRSYDELFAFLLARGVAQEHLSGGSMPQSSLEFINQILLESNPSRNPLKGIHVGNFLGVSLAHITMGARSINSESLVIAVDPNLEHRGISHPQDHVCALLNFCDLEKNVLLLCGYSTEKSVGNDGRNYLEESRVLSADEVAATMLQEHAPEHALQNIKKLCGDNLLDFALIDGNHDSSYVESELKVMRPLLRDGAYVFMDDVNEGWPNLKALFDRGTLGYQAFANDERIGVLCAC